MRSLLTNHSICLLALITSPMATLASSQDERASAVDVSSTTASDSETLKPADHSEAESAAPEAMPLSVAPLDHVEFPADRPEWIEPTVDIDRDTARIVIVSGPSATAEESRDELKEMTRAALRTYAGFVVEADPGVRFDPRMSDDEIAEAVVRQYEGTVMLGENRLYEHAVELKFTEQHHERFFRAWNNRQVASRLGALGVLTFGGLTALIGSSVFLGIVTRRRKSASAQYH